MAEVTATQVWDLIGKQVFAVVGLVSARGAGRTVGIVPTIHEGAVWFLSKDGEWKVKHARANPEVSVTYPIAKRIPFLPFIKIPAVTVTFAGTATVLPSPQIDPTVWNKLTRGIDVGESEGHVAVRIVPHGDFITYGVGTSLLGMRDTTKARGRVAVGT